MTAASLDDLARLAMERLEASADDEEFSFLFRTAGSYSLWWRRWPDADDFDGDIELMADLWTPERSQLIAEGGEPTFGELDQWRKARARYDVDQRTDSVETAWIVPIWIGDRVEGFALFIDQGFKPVLEGIYSDEAEAIGHLKAIGEVEAKWRYACCHLRRNP